VGILIFHYNSTLDFLFLLFSRPAEGIKALVPGFFTPIGAVVLVLSGFFYRRKAKRWPQWDSLKSFPLWMWLYFGTFGSAGAVLFILLVLSWMKIRSYTKGYKRSAATWGMFGYMFLFIAAWFACGIGGSPGGLL